MIARVGVLAAFLLIAACGTAPDATASADAARIDATARKAVNDVDAAQREVAVRPASPPEQTPG